MEYPLSAQSHKHTHTQNNILYIRIWTFMLLWVYVGLYLLTSTYVCVNVCMNFIIFISGWFSLLPRFALCFVYFYSRLLFSFHLCSCCFIVEICFAFFHFGQIIQKWLRALLYLRVFF